MITVALIGAGGIGTRHLQGLGLLSEPAKIEIFDASRQRVDTAMASLAHIEGCAEHEIVARDSMSELSDRFDVAIIATTASRRLAALTDTLDRASVRHVVLEKFLFQSSSEYESASTVLAAGQTRAWVNTARRMWPSYQALKARFNVGEVIDCRVSASKRLAVGMSAIHFLDLLSYVSGHHRFELNGERLILAPEASRRPGYAEFVGVINGTSAEGDSFEYIAYPVGDAPILVEMSSPRRRYLIRESDSEAWYAEEESGWTWECLEFASVPQSRLTNVVIEELVRTGECALPTFEESRVIHEQMLAVLLASFRNLTGQRVDRCPIT